MGRSGIYFTPIYGVHSSDPMCMLLDIHGCRILLDCGWSELMETAIVEPLRALAPCVHAVLLSHAHMEHCGALPYAYAKFGLRATLYCTAPVHKLAMLLMYDQYLSRRAASDFDLFTLDDVDNVFDNCVRLKYLQPQGLGGDNLRITVTAYPAGHLLGSAMWRVSVNSEDLLFVTAVNHRVERVFVRTALESFIRPAVVVADASSVGVRESKRRARDIEMQQAVVGTLREGGSVLIPVEATGRVLELLVHLEQLWAEEELEYPIVFLSHESYSMIEFVKGMLEWLNEAATKEFEHSRTNPFSFKFIRLCHDLSEVDEVAGPKVLLASLSSLEAGFSRDLFARLAPDLRNTLLFTARAPPGTLAHTLQTQKIAFPVLHLMMTTRVPLEGQELQQHLERQQAKKQQAGKQQQAAPVQVQGQAHVLQELKGEGEGAVEKDREEGGEKERGAEGEKSEGGVEGEEKAVKKAGEGREEREGEEASIGTTGDSEGEDEDPYASSLSSLLPPPFLEGLSLPDPASREKEDRGARLEGSGFGSSSAAPVVFPYSEEEQRWDEFGLVVDTDAVADLMLPSMQALSRAQAPNSDRDAVADAASALSSLERPSKVVQRQITVKVCCAIKFVDYEGLSDGRSLKTMLSHVAPQRLLLVHGTKEGTEKLQQDCAAECTCEVLAPERMQTIDLTADLATAKLQVKLSEELMHTVAFTQLPGGYAAAYVDAEVHIPPTPASPLRALPPTVAAAATQQEGHSDQQQQQQQQQAGVEEGSQAPLPDSSRSSSEADKESGEGEQQSAAAAPAAAPAAWGALVPATGAGGVSGEAIALSLKPSAPLLLKAVAEERAGAGAGQRRAAVFVGDPKLTDLKGLLHSEQTPASFSPQEGGVGGGAVLQCGPHVAVRKASTQQVVMEGALSEHYFGARELLYSQYGIL